MLQKLKRFMPSKIGKKLFKIILSILIFNVLIAILGPHLSADVPFFSGKSAMHMISDLLFLEGAVIFAIGAFLEIGTAYFPEKKTRDSGEGSHENRISPEVLFMIVGAGLIGLSMIIGLSIYA